MNKRIKSLLLCLVMIFSMVVTAVPAYAESVHNPISVSIEPDKTSAAPGDTISYSVSVSAVECLQSITFDLKISDGLEFIAGSGVIPEGLNGTLGSDEVVWTEASKVYFAYGEGSYTSDVSTVLLTFQCKVKDGASGTQEVKFGSELSMADDKYEEYKQLLFRLRPHSETGDQHRAEQEHNHYLYW